LASYYPLDDPNINGHISDNRKYGTNDILYITAYILTTETYSTFVSINDILDTYY
jgi:hypothetical protein